MEQDRVSQLWDEVQRLNARVLELEQALGERRAEAPRPPPQPAPTVQAAAPPPTPVAPQAPPPPRPAPVPAGAGGLEAEIGGNWLNKIGAVALVLGMAFFLKYAIDNRWINETGRIMIGLIVGLACLFGGEHFQKRNLNRYAQGISGAGIAILYFSIYAAFGFYDLIPQLPAFLFMILVTITAIAVSVRYDAITIAVLGIIGGFMTPVLMQKPGGGGGDSQIQLFTYIAILDLGILGATYYKNWRSLNMLSLAGTALVFAGWWGDSYEPKKLGVTLVFLTIFYVIFAAQSFVQNVLARRTMNAADLLMVGNNPRLYSGHAFRVRNQPAHGRAQCEKRLTEPFPFEIISQDAHRHWVPPETRDVGGDVGGTTQARALPADLHNGHRGLRADAADGPPDEAVQHHVAENEDLFL